MISDNKLPSHLFNQNRSKTIVKYYEPDNAHAWQSFITISAHVVRVAYYNTQVPYDIVECSKLSTRSQTDIMGPLPPVDFICKGRLNMTTCSLLPSYKRTILQRNAASTLDTQYSLFCKNMDLTARGYVVGENMQASRRLCI
jgi:hypothetical protein